MNTKKAIAIFLIVAITALSGCTAGGPPESGQQSSSESGGQGGGSATGAQLLTSMYGNYRDTPGNGGFYEVVYPRKTSANITYIDYVTQTRTYLCSSPDCSHDHEGCNSWVPGTGGCSLFMNPAKTKLFLVQHNSPQTGVPSTLSVMEPDGSNARLLHEFQPDEAFMVDEACAGDSENLYFAVNLAHQSKKQLRQFNITTGEMETLMEYGYRTWLMGAYDDQLIIVSLDMGASEYIYTAFSLADHTQREFYRFGFSPSGWQWGPIARCHKDKLYIVEPSAAGDYTADIIRMDIASGQKETLYQGMPYYSLDGTFVYDFVDDHMIISVSYNIAGYENVELSRYALDCSTTQFFELTLTYPSEEGLPFPTFIAAVGSYGDYYLVETEAKEEWMIIDGDAYQIMGTFYSLILKDDYWSNQANYIPIADTVLP